MMDSESDLWFKIVGFLQQNYAAVRQTGDGQFRIEFILEDSSLFDIIHAPSKEEAEESLMLNGFSPLASDPEALGFLPIPDRPLVKRPHANGYIYSSGRFWKNTARKEARLRKKRQRSTLILKTDDGIMIARDRNGLGLLPGGMMNRSEIAIAAAARELYEETGMTANYIEFMFKHESEFNIHHVFLAKAEGTLYPSDDVSSIEYLKDGWMEYLSKSTREILDIAEIRLSPRNAA